MWKLVASRPTRVVFFSLLFFANLFAFQIISAQPKGGTTAEEFFSARHVDQIPLSSKVALLVSVDTNVFLLRVLDERGQLLDFRLNRVVPSDWSLHALVGSIEEHLQGYRGVPGFTACFIDLESPQGILLIDELKISMQKPDHLFHHFNPSQFFEENFTRKFLVYVSQSNVAGWEASWWAALMGGLLVNVVGMNVAGTNQFSTLQLMQPTTLGTLSTAAMGLLAPLYVPEVLRSRVVKKYPRFGRIVLPALIVGAPGICAAGLRLIGAI